MSIKNIGNDQKEQIISQRLLAVVTIHDACPAFSRKIFKLASILEDLDIQYNIAVVPFFKEKQDLPRFPAFVNKIKSCKGQIALHGLYHENKRNQLDDFHTRSKAAAEEEIRAGLEILQEIGIRPSAFIPPSWKLNSQSIEVLEKLKFKLAEIQEKYILISSKTFRKKSVPKVLNWDAFGDQERNIKTIDGNKRRFKLLIEDKTKLIRIALHPRDHEQALVHQKEMIKELKHVNYIFLSYTDIQKLFL
jgi:predicted deacetylase